MAIRKIIGKSLKPSYAYLIEKKCEGGEFTEDEVRNIVDSILDDEMPDYQMAALIMAIFFKDMAAQETAVFADEMIGTGETIDLSGITRPKVAKYSTGGVGDKTSIILSAIGAACGVVVPGMSSADEDFVITVHKKLSSIPGFKNKLSLAEFHKQLANGLLRHQTIDDESHAGRNQYPQGAAYGHAAGSKLHIVFILFHFRDGNGAHGNHP